MQLLHPHFRSVAARPEFVDNSTQSYFDNKAVLDEQMQKEEDKVLTVSIVYDNKNDLLRVAEWQARAKASTIDPDTVKLLKDHLLRVPLQMESHGETAGRGISKQAAGRGG